MMFLFWSQSFLIQVFVTRLSFLTKVRDIYNRLPRKTHLYKTSLKQFIQTVIAKVLKVHPDGFAHFASENT